MILTNGEKKPSIWQIVNFLMLIITLVYVIGVRDNTIDNNTQRIEEINMEMLRRLDYIQSRVDFLIDQEINRNE